MLRTLLIVFFALLLTWPAYAKQINIVTQDRELLKGELLGVDADYVYLQTGGDRAKTIRRTDILNVFDAATGEKIALSPTAQPAANTPAPKAPAPAAPFVQESIPSATSYKNSWFFLQGNLQSGMVGYVPGRPLEDPYVPGAAYVIGMQPYDSAWGAGLTMEWRLIRFMSLGFDAGMSRWEKRLANKDGYCVGDWIWEQNDYADARVGPFPMDVFYYMETVYARMNAKYYPITGTFQPWVGLSLGMYAWQAIIGNRDEEKKYSDISADVAFSTAFQIGLDIVLMDEIVFRLFGDFGTAVAYPRFENLFQEGWTFDNTGGEHVEGPYRFGLAIGMGI